MNLLYSFAAFLMAYFAASPTNSSSRKFWGSYDINISKLSNETVNVSVNLKYDDTYYVSCFATNKPRVTECMKKASRCLYFGYSNPCKIERNIRTPCFFNLCSNYGVFYFWDLKTYLSVVIKNSSEADVYVNDLDLPLDASWMKDWRDGEDNWKNDEEWYHIRVGYTMTNDVYRKLNRTALQLIVPAMFLVDYFFQQINIRIHMCRFKIINEKQGQGRQDIADDLIWPQFAKFIDALVYIAETDKNINSYSEVGSMPEFGLSVGIPFKTSTAFIAVENFVNKEPQVGLPVSIKKLSINIINQLNSGLHKQLIFPRFALCTVHQVSDKICEGSNNIEAFEESTWILARKGLKLSEKPYSTNLKVQPRYRIAKSKFCGNGIVEEGEECDCLTQPLYQSLHNRIPEEVACKQCCTENCELKTKAQCANGVCCDLNTCKFRSSNYTCRKSMSTACDLEEFCNGTSNSCPKDNFLLAGTNCSIDGFSGNCYFKKCYSREHMCYKFTGGRPFQHTSEELAYFEKFGTPSIFSNCGHEMVLTNLSATKYTACKSYMLDCGMLRCTFNATTKDKPLLAYRREEFIPEDGDTIYATFVGVKLPDASLIPNGMTCRREWTGEKKYICKNQKCRVPLRECNAESGICDRYGKDVIKTSLELLLGSNKSSGDVLAGNCWMLLMLSFMSMLTARQ